MATMTAAVDNGNPNYAASHLVVSQCLAVVVLSNVPIALEVRAIVIGGPEMALHDSDLTRTVKEAERKAAVAEKLVATFKG